MAPPRLPPPAPLQQQLLSLIRTEVERQLAPLRVAIAKLTALAQADARSRSAPAATPKPRRAARPVPPARRRSAVPRVQPSPPKRSRNPKPAPAVDAPAPTKLPALTPARVPAFEPGDRVAFTLDGGDHTGMLLRIDRDDGTMLIDREPDGARVFVPPDAIRQA